MGATRLVAFFIAIHGVGRGEEPRTIKVGITLQYDHVELAPAGDPPTSSALTIPRVVDPRTGAPYDPSNRALGIDPKDLRRTFRLEASEVLLGEPVLVEFRIELLGPGRWEEPVGGWGRGLGRDGRFFFLMRHRDGAWVPDIYEGHEIASLGGPGGFAEVERGKPESSWQAVQAWCAIDRPGVYDLYAFHSGGEARPVGLRRRVEAALTDEMRRRVRVDRDGGLVDRETMGPPRDLFVEPTWDDGGGRGETPVARSIPEAVKARFPGAAGASDYAHFTLAVRRGDERQRRAMVDRWTGEAAGRGGGPRERAWAANTAIALARQDDFLPELERRARHGDRLALQTVFLGLAMRDDRRAVDLLFGAGVPEAIEVMRFLRPSQVPGAIPRLIDRLTDDDPLTRALAEESLRIWTGQAFGHTWKGYNHRRPTPSEGRTIQSLYRAWWGNEKDRFRPRWR